MKVPVLICAAVLAVSLVAVAVTRTWLALVAVVVSAGCLLVVYGMYQRGRE
jgi:hypothetical protein